MLTLSFTVSAEIDYLTITSQGMTFPTTKLLIKIDTNIHQKACSLGKSKLDCLDMSYKLTRLRTSHWIKCSPKEKDVPTSSSYKRIEEGTVKFWNLTDKC